LAQKLVLYKSGGENKKVRWLFEAFREPWIKSDPESSLDVCLSSFLDLWIKCAFAGTILSWITIAVLVLR